MRIRVFSHLHRPDSGGGAAIFTDLAEGLASRGHRVEIACSYPYYPEWANKSGAALLRRSQSIENDVHVTRHGMYIPKNPGSVWQRASYEATYALSLSRTVVRTDPVDAVIGFVPLLSSGLAAVADGRRHRVPTWISVQDLSGRAAAGYSTGLSSQLTKLEERVLAGADLITTIAPQMTEQLAHLDASRLGVRTFPNWLHTDAAVQIERQLSSNGHSRFDRRRPPRLLYAGNIGKKQGLDRVVTELAATDGDFHFEICGNGAGEEEVDRAVPAGDGRFTRRPFLDEGGFIERLADADAFVVPELPTASASFLPSKLLPATAVGTPILAVAGPKTPLREEVELHKTGIVIGWDEVAQIPQVARSLRSEIHQTPSALRTSLETRAALQSSTQAIDWAERLLEELVEEIGSNPTKTAGSGGRALTRSSEVPQPATM